MRGDYVLRDLDVFAGDYARVKEPQNHFQLMPDYLQFFLGVLTGTTSAVLIIIIIMRFS